MKLVVLILLFQSNIFGAACCGGSSAIPSLITGDNEAQFSLSQSYGKVIGRTYTLNKNVFYSDSKDYKSYTTSMKGAYLLTPSLQVGGGVSLLHKENKDGSVSESDTLMGDTDISLGYEFLPETFFSIWRPRGFVYFKHVLPTGKSNHETSTTLLTDVSGKGQHISSLGLVFTKIYKSIDWQFFGEFKYLFKEDINQKTVKGSIGDSLGYNIGYSPNNGAFRISHGVTRHHFVQKEIIVNNSNKNSSREEYWDFEVGLTYMINDSSFTVSYADQTFLGDTENTTLSRTLSISWLERWPL